MSLQPYASVVPYPTKDGSEIRELMHPDTHANAAQSLAEATVPPGTRTLLHRHHRSEELYHITAFEGRMTLGADAFLVRVGDTVCIAPGTANCIEAIGVEPLRLLCCCAPAYAHGAPSCWSRLLHSDLADRKIAGEPLRASPTQASAI